jgi:hypothetical protein
MTGRGCGSFDQHPSPSTGNHYFRQPGRSFVSCGYLTINAMHNRRQHGRHSQLLIFTLLFFVTASHSHLTCLFFVFFSFPAFHFSMHYLKIFLLQHPCPLSNPLTSRPPLKLQAFTILTFLYHSSTIFQ